MGLRVFATQKNSPPSCCCPLLLVSVIGLVVVSCPLTEDPSWNKAGSTVASEVEGGTVVRGAAEVEVDVGVIAGTRRGL